MSFDLELNNRRVPVTGGTKGVGAAVVDLGVGLSMEPKRTLSQIYHFELF